MRILVVDDDETLRLSLRFALEAHSYQVDEAGDGLEALAKIAESEYQTIILDVNMPKLDGLETLKKIKAAEPQMLCLILTAHSDVKDAVAAIKWGAYDYVEKPIETDHIIHILNSAKEANALVEAAVFSAPQVQFAEGQPMIGSSSEIKRVFDIIYKLAKVDTSVLIRGESGTGKELVARALHFNSHRKKGPFIAFNCAAVPENLIETELFGHEKGAFTGADKKKIGKFQFAEGGTLFLDEIGDISAAMQVKLLRVLQDKIFSPVGSNQELKADIRIVAATNRHLEKMIEEGEFRADLFYRLNVLPILLPPLRERREDIKALIDFMIRKFNKEHSRSIKKIEKQALNCLRMYSWPGNIRELENVIEHAFILESSDIIKTASLPLFVQQASNESMKDVATLGAGSSAISSPSYASSVENQNSSPTSSFSSSAAAHKSDLNFPALKEQFEKDFLVKALKTFEGKVNQTALHTKMTKVTLLRKLEKYGISAKEYHRN